MFLSINLRNYVYKVILICIKINGVTVLLKFNSINRQNFNLSISTLDSLFKLFILIFSFLFFLFFLNKAPGQLSYSVIVCACVSVFHNGERSPDIV